MWDCTITNNIIVNLIRIELPVHVAVYMVHVGQSVH